MWLPAAGNYAQKNFRLGQNKLRRYGRPLDFFQGSSNGGLDFSRTIATELAVHFFEPADKVDHFST